MERPLSGPNVDQPYLDAKEIAVWLGHAIGEKTVEALMALHLPTVRPVRMGKKKFWTWQDAAVLSYVLGRSADGVATPEPSEEE